MSSTANDATTRARLTPAVESNRDIVLMAHLPQSQSGVKPVNFDFGVWHKWGGAPRPDGVDELSCRNALQHGRKFEFSYGKEGNPSR
jgi:hypothetical protein